MGTASNAPADTTMMRIVHDALRRDLARARAALAEPDPTSRSRRAALAAHLRWMMGFVHAHHASEDDGLYPLVRERAVADAEALAALDRMAHGHADVAVAIAGVEAATEELATASDAGAAQAAAALEALEAALLPHLRDEEVAAMPIASRYVTAAEWQAIEQEHNLDPKSTAELGFEGHWLIDGASPADRARVLALVPPVPRFLLLHGFARRYRRHVAACWGPSGAAPPRRVQLDNEVEVTVDADIEAVWSVVRDVTRVGEWSHECVGATWLGGATEAVPGARFRGRNRSGPMRWGRVCEVVSAEPHELVFVTVPTTLYPDSSEWRITLTPADGGGRTTITQGFHVIRGQKVLAVVYAYLVPAHRDRTAGLVGDLMRLGAVAARTGESVPG